MRTFGKFSLYNLVTIIAGIVAFELLRSVAFAADAVSGSAIVLAPVVASHVSWIDSIGGWPVVLPILMFVAVRVETFLKNRYGVKVDSAVSVAHALFNAAAANGLISTALEKQADDYFWNNVDAQFIDSHGMKQTPAQESIAHKHFQELFTANTEIEPAVTTPKNIESPEPAK